MLNRVLEASWLWPSSKMQTAGQWLIETQLHNICFRGEGAQVEVLHLIPLIFTMYQTLDEKTLKYHGKRFLELHNSYFV